MKECCEREREEEAEEKKKKQGFPGSHSDVDTWQSTSKVNSQRLIGASRTNFVGICKYGDQMCELNFRETKCEIGVKLRDQKCNFT